jgi:hypothetical protein
MNYCEFASAESVIADRIVVGFLKLNAREICVYLRLSDVIRVECWVLTNVSAKIAIAIFKVANAMFTETLVSTRHLMRLTDESRSCTLNSNRENLRTRIRVYILHYKFRNV